MSSFKQKAIRFQANYPKTSLFILFSAFAIFFTLWYAIPYSVSRSDDARVARAFVTDEADLCEFITPVITNNQPFTFDVYGFFYYKSGIFVLKGFNKFTNVDEQFVLVFFRLYSWLYFLAFVWVITLLVIKLADFKAAIFAMLLSFIASTNLLWYSAMLHPDMAQVFFVTLALYFLYLFIEKNKILFILFSSFAAALAFSCKYSGLLVLPTIYVATFIYKAPEEQRKTKNAARDLLIVLLCLLTYYTFDNSAIAAKIQTNEVSTELLFYIKLVRYGSLLAAMLFAIGTVLSWLTTRFKLYHKIANISFMIIVSSWIFLASYLLTVKYLWTDYRFISGFLNVTSFHATGPNFSDSGGLVNWFKLMVGKDVFGYLLIPVFLLSIFYAASRLKKIEKKPKLFLLLLLLWQFTFIPLVIFRLNSVWGHYLQPAIPVFILFPALLFYQSNKVKSLFPKIAIYTILLVLLIERGVQFVDYGLEKKHEEANSASIKAGQWLVKNVDTTSILSANHYFYVPQEFKNVNFYWATELDETYSRNIDYILTHTKVLDDFADSSIAKKYLPGTELFLNRFKAREKLLNGHSSFQLLKDFGDAKVFKRTKTIDTDSLFFISCAFDSIPQRCNVDSKGIDSLNSAPNNKLWHFTPSNEWGPTYKIGLDDYLYGKAFLIEMEVKILAKGRIPNALMIFQLNNEKEMLVWKRTPIKTQMNHLGTWATLHSNLLVDKKLSHQKELKLSAYLWNLSRDDFYIDDFRLVFRELP